jgi:ABC-type bacteriocin/lantibiotic exporter with double-glycine peptidase domain
MEDEVCVICLEKGELFKKLYHLPCNCNYYIHKNCSKNINKDVCLICKNNYLNKEEINIQVIDKHNKQIVYLNENRHINKNNKYCKFNFNNYIPCLTTNFFILSIIIFIIHLLFLIGFIFISLISYNKVFFYDAMNFVCGLIICILFFWILRPCCIDSDYD